MVRKKIVKKISNFIGEQKASLHPIAIGLAACGIYGVAHSSDLPSQPKTKANSVIFERSAPPGFKASADGGLDHALKFKKTLYRDIIFVQANDSKQGYILAPVALRSFQKLLLSIGLHEPAVEQLVRKVRWELGEEQCVALQEQPQNWS